MSILKVPIQINGGTKVPDNLLDRELFIDSEGYLHCGKGTTTPIIINANKCNELHNGDVWINGSGATFGSLDITPIGDGSWLIKATNTDEAQSIMQSIDIDDCALTNLNKLQLTSDVYGNTPPSTAIDGQVFFKIVEN